MSRLCLPGECRESKGCCLHSQHGQLLCRARLGQGRADKCRGALQMGMGHCSPLSTNKMLEMWQLLSNVSPINK